MQLCWRMFPDRPSNQAHAGFAEYVTLVEGLWLVEVRIVMVLGLCQHSPEETLPVSMKIPQHKDTFHSRCPHHRKFRGEYCRKYL